MPPTSTRAAAVPVACAAAFLVGSAPASAATFSVTTTTDASSPLDGVTSLREAVALATAAPGADTVALAPGASYTLTDCGPGALVYGEDAPLVIEGSGATITQTCDGARIFESTATSSTFDLRHVELVGGPNTADALTYGMAVLAGPEGSSNGRIALDDVEIHGVDAAGGTLLEPGFGNGTDPYQLDVTASYLHDNVGTAVGGSFASIHVADTVITGNTGSGIGAVDGYPMLVESSTVSGNGGTGISTTGQGYPANRMTVDDVIVDGNGRGGIRCSFCGTVSIANATVTGNGHTGTFTTGGIAAVLGQISTTASTLSITSSTITGNAALNTYGGGITARVDYAEDPAPAPVVTLGDVTVGDNEAEADGGGIRMGSGTLDLTGSTISGNTAGGSGGGLWTGFTSALTVTDTDVVGNTAARFGGGMRAGAAAVTLDAVRASGNAAATGGGLAAVSSAVTVTRSTVDDNTATADAGGAYLDVEGVAEVRNSTIDGNTAAGSGGGTFVAEGAMRLDHVTASDNAAATGAHIARSFGQAVVRRSALVTPIGATACDTPAASTETSLLADASCGSTATDLVSAADPQLAPLADNGGLTPTRLPAPTSPAAGLVPTAACPLPTDQRGLARPQGAACDAGAVEITEAVAAAPIMGTALADLLRGTRGPDVMLGLAGADLLLGLAGDDSLDGGPDGDLLIGGPGDDELFGGPGDDLLIGGPGRDRLVGGPGDDLLIGGPGRDRLVGGPGRDLLIGGPGDQLDGGPGRDRCVWQGGRPRDC